MSMHVIIETPRLLLREFNPGDADLIYTLNEDPEITRYTLDPVRDRAHAQDILDTVILPQYSLYRYGRWAVHIRENLEFIGWCGLKFRPEPGETDLGYRFMKKAWERVMPPKRPMPVYNLVFGKESFPSLSGGPFRPIWLPCGCWKNVV